MLSLYEMTKDTAESQRNFGYILHVWGHALLFVAGNGSLDSVAHHSVELRKRCPEDTPEMIPFAGLDGCGEK